MASLEAFKGPMEALISQVQQREIEIFEIWLAPLAREFQAKEDRAILDGAKFIAGLSHLMYLKAFRLLPREELTSADEEGAAIERDLEEYKAFKAVAELFSKKEREQSGLFWRAVSFLPEALPSPVLQPQMPLEEFSKLFHKMLEKAEKRVVAISEDAYKIVDVMRDLRSRLKTAALTFHELFVPGSHKLLLIATFLAVLELIKNQEALIVYQNDTLVLEKIS